MIIFLCGERMIDYENGLNEVTSLKDLYHIIAELSEIKPLHLLSQGLFTQFRER